MIRDLTITLLICICANGFAQTDAYPEYEYSSNYWVPDYQIESKRPYGGFMLDELVMYRHSYSYMVEPFADYAENILEYSYGEGNYVYLFYGYDMHFRQSDISALRRFVYAGNDAIIICEYLPDALQRKFFKGDWTTIDDSSVSLFYGADDYYEVTDTLELNYISNFKQKDYSWRQIHRDDITNFRQINMEVLAHVNRSFAAGVKLKYGDGYFYFFSTPMLFSNLYLKTEKGMAYFDHFFSRFSDKEFIIDHYSVEPIVIYYTGFDFGPGQGGEGGSEDNEEREEQRSGGGPSAAPRFEVKQSPLSYVLSNTVLTWTYILLILMGILFLIFKAKRRRKIIPLLETDENTSLEFVETISRLYLSKKQHKNLVGQKKRILMNHIKNKYFIFGKDSDEYRKKVAIRSGVDRKVIDEIFDTFKKADSGKGINTEELIEIHHNIEHFYKNSN